MWEVIGAVVVALLSASAGIIAERLRNKREMSKEERQERDVSLGRFADLEKARLQTDMERSRDIEIAAKDLREFLAAQVKELTQAIDDIENEREIERRECEKIKLSSLRVTWENDQLREQNGSLKAMIEGYKVVIGKYEDEKLKAGG